MKISISIKIRSLIINVNPPTRRDSWCLREQEKNLEQRTCKNLYANDVKCRITTDRYTCIELPREFLECRGPKLSHVFCYLPKITGLQETQRRWEQSTTLQPSEQPTLSRALRAPESPAPRGRYHDHLPPSAAQHPTLHSVCLRNSSLQNARHPRVAATAASTQRLGREREIE